MPPTAVLAGHGLVASGGSSPYAGLPISVATAAGHTLAAWVTSNGSSVTGFADSVNGAYTQAGATVTNGTLSGSWWVFQGAAALAVTATLSITMSGTSGEKTYELYDCANVGAAALDASAEATANTPSPSATPSVTSGALAKASEVVLAGSVSANGGGTPTWSAPFSGGVLAGDHTTGQQYSAASALVVSSAAAVTASAAITSAAWGMSVIALKASESASIAVTVPKPTTAATATVAAQFPAGPLDIAADINLGGTWTPISGYLYQREGSSPAITITGGRPNESAQATPSSMTVQVNNRDGSFTSGNPLGQWYGQIGKNTPIRVSVPSQQACLRLETDLGSYAACPSSSALNITGDLDVRVDVNLSGHTPGVLAAKWSPGGVSNSWALLLNGDGTVTFQWSTTGGDTAAVTSTAPIPFGRCMIRAILTASTGKVTFWTAATIGSGSETQLGQPVGGAGAASVFAGSAPVTVGNYGPGTAGAGGLIGATTTLANYGDSSYLVTANTYNRYTGTSAATTVCRIYYPPGHWPASPNAQMTQLGAVGCQFQLCMKPLQTMTSAERVNMANQIAMLQAAGFTFDVVLWTEPNVASHFSSATAFKNYIAYYGPVAADPAAYWTSGGTPPVPVNLIYNAASYQMAEALDYYPGDGYSGASYTFAALTLDYYGNDWHNAGILLDAFAALADSEGKPLGISEWASSANGAAPLSGPNFTAFCAYLVNFFSARLAVGKTNYNIIYFNENNSPPVKNNVVTGPSDIKVPGSQNVASNITGGTPSTPSQGITGNVYEFRLQTDSTIMADAVFTAQAAATTSFTDAYTNTWSVYGTAEISKRSYRFHGEMSSSPKATDPTLSDVYVPLTAGGLLRRLQQGNAPEYSPMRRGLQSQSGTLACIVYWPAEDLQGSTSIGSATGGPAMMVTGGTGDGSVTHTGPAFASDSTFACSDALPVCNGAVMHGVVPTYEPSGQVVFRFLMNIQDTPPNEARIMRLILVGGTISELSLYYTTSGGMGMAGYNSSGTVFDSGPVAMAVDSEPVWVSMELRPGTGSTIDWSFVTLQPGADFGLAPFGSVSGTIGNVTDVYPNPQGLLQQTTLGHISLQSGWESLFALYEPLNAWIGETAGNRFARLCGENGLAVRVYGYPDTTAAMGAQPVDTLPDLLQQCETADRGMIYEPRQAYALGYRTLVSLLNQPAAVTLDWSQSHLAAAKWQPPTDDDHYTCNDVTATRESGGSSGSSGATYRTLLDDGSAMSISPPPAGVGDYATSASLNLQADTQLPDAAGWIVHVGTVDEPRWPAIPTDLARTATASLFWTLQGVKTGDRIDQVNLPTWLSYDGVRQLAAGVTEELSAFIWRITWNGIPESPYETGIWDDPVYGRADTDGASLDASTGTTDTTFDVDTADGVPLWTTDSTDFPFDISVRPASAAGKGEQITVTNITGTSSPQTFTVVRSVNGVVVAHDAGELVELFYTPIYAIA